MNIEKLIKLARQENPNPLLAKLSLYWERENKKCDENPVKNAISLWHYRLFRRISISLILFYIITTIVWRPSMFIAYAPKGHNPSAWLIIGIALVFVPVMIRAMIENWTAPNLNNAKKFAEAISLLESVIGRPFEDWENSNDLQLKDIALNHLKDKAHDVESAEKVEINDKESVPWVKPSSIKTTIYKKKLFNLHFGLLTTLLPLSKDMGVYFENKTTKTEASNKKTSKG